LGGIPHQRHLSFCLVSRRISARRGAERAIVAVGHSILISVFYMWKNNEPYREVGDAYLDKIKPEKTANRLLKRLAKLGYLVTVTQVPTPQA